MKPKPPIELSPDARKQAIASLKTYFAENFDDEIGDLKAGLLLDYILAEHGPAIYNKAIADAQHFFEERSADLGAIAFQKEFPFWQAKKKSS